MKDLTSLEIGRFSEKRFGLQADLPRTISEALTARSRRHAFAVISASLIVVWPPTTLGEIKRADCEFGSRKTRRRNANIFAARARIFGNACSCNVRVL